MASTPGILWMIRSCDRWSAFQEELHHWDRLLRQITAIASFGSRLRRCTQAPPDQNLGKAWCVGCLRTSNWEDGWVTADTSDQYWGWSKRLVHVWVLGLVLAQLRQGQGANLSPSHLIQQWSSQKQQSSLIVLMSIWPICASKGWIHQFIRLPWLSILQLGFWIMYQQCGLVW